MKEGRIVKPPERNQSRFSLNFSHWFNRMVMRFTFTTDDCMVITIPLGNLLNAGDGELMPEKFTCVFKDAYKVFLRGRPKTLGVAQLIAALLIICLWGILITHKSNNTTFMFIPLSAVFIVCGIMSYAAGKSPIMTVMKISFLFNIIGLFWAIMAFVVCVLAIQHYMDKELMPTGLLIVIILLHGFEFVLTAVLIFWESKAICKPHFNTLPMITLKQDISDQPRTFTLGRRQ